MTHIVWLQSGASMSDDCTTQTAAMPLPCHSKNSINHVSISMDGAYDHVPVIVGGATVRVVISYDYMQCTMG